MVSLDHNHRIHVPHRIQQQLRKDGSDGNRFFMCIERSYWSIGYILKSFHTVNPLRPNVFSNPHH